MIYRFSIDLATGSIDLRPEAVSEESIGNLSTETKNLSTDGEGAVHPLCLHPGHLIVR